jgi:hypothetical protein
MQLGANVFRDVLPTAQLVKVLRYDIETWNKFSQRNRNCRVGVILDYMTNKMNHTIILVFTGGDLRRLKG